MISKSLAQAIKDAEKEMPAGGSAAWEDGEYTVIVVAANVTHQFDSQQLGLQLQRESDSSRRWFNLSFDDTNPKWLAMTGRKLAALGLSDTLDALSTQFPEDVDAQLNGLAAAVVGIKFVTSIAKVEKNKTKNDSTLSAAQREYINFFDIKSLVEGPVSAPVATPPATGLGGLGGLGGLMG